jgi:hypothetical protein
MGRWISNTRQPRALGNWSLTGNTGTTDGPNFLGTTDNQPLELHVNRCAGVAVGADS